MISYDDLLDIFWDNHHPEYPSGSAQYRSKIYYHDDDQKRLAEESKTAREDLIGKFITTEVVQFERLFLAEAYHQKYYLKLNDSLFLELRTIYPNPGDLTNSTAAAKINGFMGDFGGNEYFYTIKDDLGLSNESIAIIETRLR